MNCKKLYLISILTFIWINGFSQKIIENPKKASIDLLGKITKIEISDSLTVFHFYKKTKDSISFRLSKGIYIETDLNKTKYFLLRTEGIDLDKKIFLDAKSDINYKLYFQPINKKTKTFRIWQENEIKSIGDEKSKTERVLSSYIELNPKEKLQKNENIFENISLEKALEKAKKEDKNLFLFFTAGWCGPCKWMKKYVFSDSEVGSFIKSNFIALEIDVDSEKGEKLSKIYRSENSVPQSIIINNNGSILKTVIGSVKKENFLDFLKVDSDAKPNPVTSKKIISNRKYKTVGLRIGAINNKIDNYFDAQSRIGFTADLFYSIDYNGRYLIRPGIGFSSEGIKGLSVNYLKIPVEFGYSIYKGSLFNLPGSVKIIGAPYYAFRLNKNELGISKNDYGMRLGIAPHIGQGDKLEFQLYYDLGMKDLFKNINGSQKNKSFGIGISLSIDK